MTRILHSSDRGFLVPFPFTFLSIWLIPLNYLPPFGPSPKPPQKLNKMLSSTIALCTLLVNTLRVSYLHDSSCGARATLHLPYNWQKSDPFFIVLRYYHNIMINNSLTSTTFYLPRVGLNRTKTAVCTAAASCIANLVPFTNSK